MSQELKPTDPSTAKSFQKPRSNVYTVMLILSLIAIIVGCVLLWLEMAPYRKDSGWPWDVPVSSLPIFKSSVLAVLDGFSLFGNA